MNKKKIPRWERFEIDCCDYLSMEHKGGSGKADCINPKDPTQIAEAKSYSRAFNAYDLKREVKNAKKHGGEQIEIMVEEDCTKNAKELAKKLPGVKLTCNCNSLFKKRGKKEKN